MNEPKTLADLHKELLAGLQDKYELVNVDYREEFSDKSVAAIVRGDFETLDDENQEWESENRTDSLFYIVREDVQDILNGWDKAGFEYDIDFEDYRDTDLFDELREAIEERDNSDPYRQLARNTGDVLLRMSAIDEDAGFSFEQVTADQVLDAIGFEHSEHNRQAIDKCLLEVSPEFGVTLGEWIVGVDIEKVYDLPNSETDYPVELVNPYLFLGNPFSGRGWLTEVALEGIATVQRSELRTDKDAWGYGISEIFGRPYASEYSAEIRVKQA